MGMEQGESNFALSAAVACTAADLYVFTPATPVDVIRWGVIVTTAFGANAWACAGDTRPTANSDSGRVDASGGTIGDSAAHAAGTVVYHNCNPIVEIDPGEQFVIQGTDASGEGVGFWFVEYRMRPFVAPRIAKCTEDAS